MRCIILLNGEPHRGEIDTAGAYVICCDGAYSWAHGKVRIDENLGDFDSLKEAPIPSPREVFPAEKNETDGELATLRAISLGATQIEYYGAGGGREDHFLGNLHLLFLARAAGVDAMLITRGAKISLCGAGRQKFSCKEGKTVSLLPFGGDAHIMEMEGFKYAPDDLHLAYGSTRGISNIARGGFSFRVESGHVLVIINEEVA